MKKIVAVVGIVVLGIVVGILINSAIVYGICWGLNAIGITSIFGWTVKFSWPLVILFTVIYAVLRDVFKKDE